MRLFLVLFCLGFSSISFAYIPQTKMILEKTAGRHGRGLYIVTQEVFFEIDNQTKTMSERWLVANGETFLLTASGFGKTFKILYRNGKKYFFNPEEKLMSATLTDDFYEGIFHFRSGRSLAELLRKWQLIPANVALKVSGGPSADKYTPEGFVRLTRSGGIINWMYGTTNGTHFQIEQDVFHIRRLRLPTHVVVNADDYQDHSAGLWYPRLREVLWGEDKKTLVKTVKVLRLGQQSVYAKKLSLAEFSKNENVKSSFEGLPIEIKEFYNRFR